MSNVAVITGGASGMGLAVATALVNRPSSEWTVHILDLNSSSGEKAAASLPNTTFHKTDVACYPSLSGVFDTIYKTSKRIDFVFANAGIVEKWNFYAVNNVEGPPPEPDQLSVDVDLKSVISTVYLAQHYFRKSKDGYGKGGQNVVMTSSCGGIYPTPFCPMYTAAKHGVIGLTRAVAKHMFYHDGIRINCICPGLVRTSLNSEEAWSSFPENYFTPVENIVEVVLRLVDGDEIKDSKGVVIPKGQAWMKALEINGEKFYVREQPEYCDEVMQKIMEKTDVIDVSGE